MNIEQYLSEPPYGAKKPLTGKGVRRLIAALNRGQIIYLNADGYAISAKMTLLNTNAPGIKKTSVIVRVDNILLLLENNKVSPLKTQRSEVVNKFLKVTNRHDFLSETARFLLIEESGEMAHSSVFKSRGVAEPIFDTAEEFFSHMKYNDVRSLNALTKKEHDFLAVKNLNKRMEGVEIK